MDGGAALPTAMRHRYAALAVFCLFTFNNGFAWLVFDPVVADVEALFALTPADIQLLSSWQPLVYILGFYALSSLLTRTDGLRRAVVVGAALEVTGAMLKVAASTGGLGRSGVALLHLGQICSAVGSPVAIGAPSLLSALWFPPEQRTRATAGAVLFNNVGNAAVYLLVPPVTQRLGFQVVLLAELVLAIAALTLVLAAMPSTGARRHAMAEEGDGGQEGLGQGAEPPAVWRDLVVLFTTPSAVLLFLVYAWSSGGYVAWTSLFDEVLGGRFGDVFIGRLSFASTVAYIAGGFGAAALTDAFFRRHMKSVLLTATAVNGLASLCFAWLTAQDRQAPPWAVAAAAAATGACSGAAAPVFYELVAELSFPVSEGVSGNCMSLCENAGALVLYQVVVRVVGVERVSTAYAAGIALALLLCAMVRERYRRPAFRDVSDSDFDNEPVQLVGCPTPAP